MRVVRPGGPSHLKSPAEPSSQFPAKQIIGWEQFVDLPTPCEHEELDLKYAYDFEAGTLRLECPEVAFDLTSPLNACPAEDIADSEGGDKLAGWPAWVQGVEYPRCPQCGQRMIHVFQMESEDNIPFM